MVANGSAALFCTLFCLCFIFGTQCFSGASNSIISAKTGGLVTIPCYYDKKYTHQRKFWYSEIDKRVIYTNTSKGNVSVIDYPAASLFIVTLRDVKSSQNGGYSCFVETDGPSKSNSVTFEHHLDVQDAPDVSVVNSSVSADEDGNISVKCLYSSKYKNIDKKWCRYKDKMCYGVKRSDTSKKSSVEISDDDESKSFTVMMSGLMLNDSGWYFCSVGDLQVPVQLTVNAKTAAVTPETSTENNNRSETGSTANSNIITLREQQKSNTVLLWLPVSIGLLLLVILVGVLIWKWISEEQIKMRNNDAVSFTPEDPTIYSTINDENPDKLTPLDSTDIYSTIADPPGNKAESPPAGGTIYSTVAPH